ncbi:hypothetical protein [Luteolibacter soli]|uniref:KAP NTPase domain-containing protein n=1 Tax=Luteolibacter soli TaxID=3135280 RepID=A0ABU9B0H8_9BACT
MISPLERSLENFLSNDSLRVAVIKGEWGVGKTFFWRSFLSNRLSGLKFTAYAYASLFGATSIEALTSQISSNFKIVDEQSPKKHLEKLGPILKYAGYFQTPHVNLVGIANKVVESHLINNFLVCIDDLERKEESVSTSSVLGMISLLTQDRGCKVVLILNDDKLSADAAKAFDEYREKVVDLEITYSPSISDNLRIIWQSGIPESVSAAFHRLKLNNIRVMQRVAWAIEYFEKDISEKYPFILHSFLEKCVILTIVHHAFSSVVSIEEVLKSNYYSLFLDKDEREKPDLEFLKKLEFYPAEEDEVIVDYLIHGFAKLADWDELLTSRNEANRVGNITAIHRQIWARYYTNFTTSHREFVEQQIQFLREHGSDVSVAEFATVVDFLKQLKVRIPKDVSISFEASLNRFVAAMTHGRWFDLTMSRLPESVRVKATEKMEATIPDFTLDELLKRLAGSNSWNPSELKFLANFSSREIEEWIKTSDSDVQYILKEFIRRFSQDQAAAEAISLMRGILSKLRRRSKLDESRVDSILPPA